MAGLPILYETIRKEEKINPNHSMEPADKKNRDAANSNRYSNDSEEYWQYLFNCAQRQNTKRTFKDPRDSDEYFDYLEKQAKSYNQHDKVFGNNYSFQSDNSVTHDDKKDVYEGISDIGEAVNKLFGSSDDTTISI